MILVHEPQLVQLPIPHSTPGIQRAVPMRIFPAISLTQSKTAREST